MADKQFGRALRARTKSIYWEAPVIMYVSFTAAIIFSILHHIFYVYLHGQIVVDDVAQQWVQRSGTAIAFLVKLLFATAAGTAYTQWFWFRLNRTPTTLKRVDILYGITFQPVWFAHIRVWFKNFPLAFLAVVIWLLPLSAIITPGAITVQQTSRTSTQSRRIPEADLPSGLYTGSNRRSEKGYSTGIDLSYLSFHTLVTGKQRQVPHSDTGTNVTFLTSFHAPALSCSAADNETAAMVSQAVIGYQSKHGLALPLIVFSPGPGFGRGMNGSYFENSRLLQDAFQNLDSVSSDVSRLYIQVSTRDNANKTVGNLVECQFYNATYETKFNLLSNGDQKLNVKRMSSHTISTKSLMQVAAGGYVAMMRSPKWEREPTAYIALISSFTELVIGGLSYRRDKADRESFDSSTNIPAMAYNPQMREYLKDTSLNTFNASEIGNTLESLLENITLSTRYGWGEPYIEQKYYQYITNLTVNATVSTSQTVFNYTPVDLWAVYGVSIFLSAICTAMGSYAMIQEGRSFSPSFSTILRFVMGLGLKDETEDPKRGADPLPPEFKSLVLDTKDARSLTTIQVP